MQLKKCTKKRKSFPAPLQINLGLWEKILFFWLRDRNSAYHI